jgi:hypothetical protein
VQAGVERRLAIGETPLPGIEGDAAWFPAGRALAELLRTQLPRVPSIGYVKKVARLIQ